MTKSWKKSYRLRFLHWVLFSWSGKRWIFRRSWLILLGVSDFFKASWHKKPSRALYKQLSFHRIFRSPRVLTEGFQETLRVCITYKCNLRCSYCYACGLEKDFPQDMTVENFKKLISWAKSNRWTVIRFLGGEPTSHPDFSEMLDICRQNQMRIGMATNNIYPTSLLSRIDRIHKQFFSINYNNDFLDKKQKKIFEDNLQQLSAKKMLFEFSLVIDRKSVDLKNLFTLANKYKPIAIRASIAIPGFSGDRSLEELRKNFGAVFGQIAKIQEQCIKLEIPFYMYRPLLPCLFESGQWEKLKRVFPFVCFTRCPIGVKGDYAQAVVVNPDLSIFPCIAIFVKGPNILSFDSRQQISEFYKDALKKKISAPLMDECKSCQKHEKFLKSIQEPRQQKTTSYYEETLCQGGCLSFREGVHSGCNAE